MSAGPRTNEEWASYLSGSSDPDDQSLAIRIGLVGRLKAKRELLNRRDAQLLQLLERMNAVELYFLKQPSSYRISHARPCWPRWHWSEELEDYFHRSSEDQTIDQ
jgi:hypothetical protein